MKQPTQRQRWLIFLLLLKLINFQEFIYNNKNHQMESQSTISTRALKQYQNIYLCPLTMEVMNEPYVLPCQHTFELVIIKKHLDNKQQCPMCRRPAKFDDGAKNLLAKQGIQIYKKQLERKQIKQKKQFYHPGYLECKIEGNPNKNWSWYQDQQHMNYVRKEYGSSEEFKIRNKLFVRSLKEGGFIPCGTSGNVLRTTANGKIDNDFKYDNHLNCLKGTWCCDWLRTNCSHGAWNTLKFNSIERRWSCCKQISIATVKQMEKIKGCVRK